MSKEECLILPLLVVYSNKLRLVVDASRHINPFVTKRKVRLNLLDDFAFLVQEGDYLAVDNLDSGYLHMPKHPSQYPYLMSSKRRPCITSG